MIDQREADFYKRIKQHRPQSIRINMVPGAQSKMPDYYGEKITSVREYRNWIKQQKLFIARLNTGRLNLDE